MMNAKHIFAAMACLMLAGCRLLPDREYRYSSPYSYSYTLPYGMRALPHGMREMTPLKPGNTEVCREFFPGADFITGSFVHIPTNATVIGQFIVIHGNNLKDLPIYTWRSADGTPWFAVDHIGYSPQFEAHSYRDFMSEIEKQLGNGYESVTPPRGQK